MSLSNFSITTKRSYRRLLVVLFYGLLVLGGFLSTTRFDPGTWGGAVFGGTFTLLLLVATGNIIFALSNQLDERQQRLQSLAFRSAYLTLMGLAVLYIVLVSVLELSWLSSWLSSLPTTRLLAVVGVLVILLPITIVAWTEPDPIEEKTPVAAKEAL